MDHYLTTYIKDYTWPNVGAYQKGFSSLPGGTDFKPTAEELAFLEACLKNQRPGDCRCPQYGGAGGGVVGQAGDSTETHHWTGAQPMGALLDPKLFPAKVGAPPEAPNAKYDKPNAFLDQLQSKYPLLYTILQNAPSAEIRSRIERDRNKTTYTVDYCESGPGAKFANLQRAADSSGTGPCAGPIRLPGDPCRTGTSQKTFGRYASITKGPGAGGGGSGGGGALIDSGMPPLGRSEYQDGVSKLGGIIMRDKLHRRKK